jgi:hypothetical protein
MRAGGQDANYNVFFFNDDGNTSARKLKINGDTTQNAERVLEITRGTHQKCWFGMNINAGNFNGRVDSGDHGLFWSNQDNDAWNGGTPGNWINNTNDFIIAPHRVDALAVTTYVGLTILATGGVVSNSFSADSDYRLKENIQTISSEEFTVDELRPVSYTLKSNQKPALGFIAHEIQEHVPSAVSGEKDGEKMQSVDYNQIIPILVKEIQELKKRVAYLEQNQK